MIKETTCQLSQLSLDLDYLSAMLGFSDGVLPEPFDQYVNQAIEEAKDLCDIRGAYYWADNLTFNENNSQIFIGGHSFGVGKTVARELRNSISGILFICTAGRGISDRSQELLKGDDPVLGYVFDLLGSMIVEAAMDKMQLEIELFAIAKGFRITNRYSPGYCKWSVADQHKLFSFFPDQCCGISLTNSSLMHPIKSVSGIIGFGKEVKFRDYTCGLCSQIDCFHRNHNKLKSESQGGTG